MKRVLAIIFAGVCGVLLINIGYANSFSVKKISCNAKSKIISGKKKIKSHKAKKTLAKSKLTFTASRGFLWPNLRKFARQFHYHLIWNVQDNNTGEYLDYHWNGAQKIVGKTSLDILKKMLKPYPITVNVWKTNKVIKINN